MPDVSRDPLVIIGAGPAGLTAARELVVRGVKPVVLDADERVGGLAQTADYKGFKFDIGGHRFFTKVAPVRDLWRAVLGPDFIRRPRLSRIYYRGRLFQYPLRPLDALGKLGIGSAIAVLASYLRVKLFPIRPEVSFADWVSNRFGRKLYGIFFESYTEKVWGTPGTEISAQWAAQRIKGLSLRTAILDMLRPAARRNGAGVVTTLIGEFEYPRFGPGMMWEAFRREVEAGGGRVELNARVTGLGHDGTRITSVVVEQGGETVRRPAGHVISTMPIRELVNGFDPPAPPDVVAAANRLKYRDFITVALIVDAADVFPDNWIYVHEPSVRVGRLQNFKNWSPDMVPDRSKTCLGLEYFCNEGDNLWAMSDAGLLALGRRELAELKLVDADRILDGTVIRMKKAYPVYDDGYEDALATVRTYVDRFDNLQLVGRNGMHKYNNQDHSMVTAMLAVRNLFGEAHDLWAINAEDEYHEELSSTAPDLDLAALRATQPYVPRRAG